MHHIRATSARELLMLDMSSRDTSSRQNFSDQAMRLTDASAGTGMNHRRSAFSQLPLKHDRISMHGKDYTASRETQHRNSSLHSATLLQQFWFLIFFAGFGDSGRSWLLYRAFCVSPPEVTGNNGISCTLNYLASCPRIAVGLTEFSLS